MCKSGKIINVVLNSNNALVTAAADVSNNNLTYNVDWSAILKPRQAYKLHWSYVGQPNTLTASSKLAQVQINFQMEQYLGRSSTFGAPISLTIGCLRSFFLNGTVNYLFADDNNNPPIYLQNRPGNNTFRVQVLTNDATPVVWVDNAGTPVANGSYILTLSFQEVDSEDM
jgi:hypothetical protein